MIKTFLSALLFYTRLPVAGLIRGEPTSLEKSTPFLPVVGLVVGGISAGCWFVTRLFFPAEPAAVMAIISGVLLTGAFHEDGFADSLDGLGGGWSIEEKLKIMKDSRIGAYGSIGTVLQLLLKYSLLINIPQSGVVPSLILVHCTSRIVPLWIIRNLSYARSGAAVQPGKSQDVAAGINSSALAAATVFPLAASAGLFYLMLPGQWPLLFAPIALAALLLVLIPLYKRLLGGYTGDMLGAAQQLGELVVFASLVGIWNFWQ